MIANAKTYVFGDFRLVPSESLLLQDVQAIPLPLKALNLLEKLVENAGSIVTKDELIRDVWDDLAIEESAVSRTVFLVRTALGDDPKNPTFIQTVPKRGYRFVAEVSTLNGPSEEGVQAGAVANASTIREAVRRRFSAIHLAGALLLLAAATTGAYFGFLRDGPVASKPSLLVMPVTSAGNQVGDELLENGIAEALIHHLASSKEITVRPLSATQSYLGKTSDPVQAGREQKVNKVFSASYQRADGKLRILARLINVETGEIEEPYKFETGETGIFAIQDAIAADLGNKIAFRLGTAIGRVRTHGTTNEEAYRLYLQAIYLIDRRSPANSEKAREYLERAVALDPNYAQAWARIALAVRYSGRTDSVQMHQELVLAANRALTIDPEVSDAYTALCEDKVLYYYDFPGAEPLCRRAIQADPNSSTARRAYFWVLMDSGRHDEAMVEIRKAMELEPISYINQRIYGNALYRLGRFDEAAEQWKRVMSFDPSDAVPYHQLIRTLSADGKVDEAFEWLIKLLIHRKNSPKTIDRYTSIYQKLGWRAVLLERATDPPNAPGGGSHFDIATLYAEAGEKDLAFHHLEKSFENREWNFSRIWQGPELKNLRDDRRYLDLLSRVVSR